MNHTKKQKKTIVKKCLTTVLAFAMVLNASAFSVFAAETQPAEDIKGVYEVPVSLISSAPLPPVNEAFKGAFGEKVTIEERTDGTKTVTAIPQHMIINIMGSGYHANIFSVLENPKDRDAGATNISYPEMQKVLVSKNFGEPETVEIDAPKVVKFDLPKKTNEKGQYVLNLTVDFMNNFIGGGKEYPTNVALVLDEEHKTEIKADYTKVNNAINKIPADLSKYTDETVAALNEAKEAVVYELGITKQAEVDKMATDIENAIKALKEKAEGVLEDGTYEVNVRLWNATSDKASMAAQALKEKAKIVVKDGKAIMHIYTQPMKMGTIVASLQELKVFPLTGENFENGKIEAKSADGNPIEFSFNLPHNEEYIRVLVNPHVEMMGNMDLPARIKIDYSSLKRVADVTPENNKPETDNTHSDTVKPQETNKNVAPKTGDNNAMAIYLVSGLMAVAAVVVLRKRKNIIGE